MPFEHTQSWLYVLYIRYDDVVSTINVMAIQLTGNTLQFKIVLLIDHDVSVYIQCCMGVPFECNYQVILFIGECARAIFSGSITIMF